MLTYLRIAVTALSLTACVLLVALWVRSYWIYDLVSRENSSGQVSAFGSHGGTMYFARTPPNPTTGYGGLYGGGMVGSYAHLRRAHGWRHSSGEVIDLAGGASLRWKVASGNTQIILPHWLLVLVASAVAAIPWLKWSRRFSLSTLFIATTLIAVGLGIIVVSN